MKNYCRKLLLLAMLMASLLCFTFTIFAQPKGSAANGKVTDASAKATKEATRTIRLAKGSKMALAAGHRFVRLGPNQTAVYKANEETGVTVQCRCFGDEGGACNISIEPKVVYCNNKGCKSCGLVVSLPPSQASIFREIKAVTHEEGQKDR
jgi:heterodisulfide reductase subunit A-like polyferredoxin